MNLSEHQLLDALDRDFGISFPSHVPVLAPENEYRDMFFNAFNSRNNRMARDSDSWTYNPASNGFPFWTAMVNMNKVVDPLLKVRQYEEIGQPMQRGDWTTDSLYFTSLGLNGQVVGYGDYNGDGVSDVNVTFPNRDVFRGQTNFQYGELEVAKAANAGLNLVDKKYYSATQNIAIATNKIFFFGNLNSAGAFVSNTFGLTNDPQLNPAVVAPAGAGGSPLWSVKASTPTGAQEIANDVIVTAIKQMNIQMGGNFNQNMPLVMIYSTTVESYLNTTASVALRNAKMIIQDTLPNIKFIKAPEYTSLGIFQLIATDTTGENLVTDLYTYKLRGHNLVTQESSYRQKLSFGTAGCAILQYAPIVTVSGIE